MSHYCKECGREIPQKRAELGYQTTCVEHSDTIKWTGFYIQQDQDITDIYEIQIIKNPEIAAHMQKLARLY